MADREKVIKAIEVCYTVGHNCTECPFFCKDECNDELMHEVLVLLREQEPVEPIVRCKDCKHGEIDTCINGVLLSITCDGVKHKPEWFCADGERED